MSFTWTRFSYAKDQRVTIKQTTLQFFNEKATLMVIDIDPTRWDGQPLTEKEFLLRHFAEKALRSVQTFLYDVHKEHQSQRSHHSPVESLILNSFERIADPFHQLTWTDAGKTSHKVDDYFERRSHIVIVFKNDQLTAENIIGSLKFVVSDPKRILAPLIGDYEGLLGVPISDPNINELNHTVLIELENLARRFTTLPVVDLMFFESLNSDFFDFVRPPDSVRSDIHLNSESFLVPYYQNMGFEIDASYYVDLPAARMKINTLKFLRSYFLQSSYTLKGRHYNHLIEKLKQLKLMNSEFENDDLPIAQPIFTSDNLCDFFLSY